MGRVVMVPIHDQGATPLVEEVGKILYWGHGGGGSTFWQNGCTRLERPIHPKCGEEACDLVAHSSKEWRRSMWLGGPFIQSVEEKHVMWWHIHPKSGGEACDLASHSSKSVGEKHVTWRPFIQKCKGRSVWLGGHSSKSVGEKHVTWRPFIQKCGGEACDLEASHRKCGGEACDLEAIHPKSGGEACDLASHSSKSVGKKHVTWRPFIQKCKGRDTWLGHPKCVWLQEVKSMKWGKGRNKWLWRKWIRKPFLYKPISS